MTASGRPPTLDERKTLSEIPVSTPPFHLCWNVAIGSVGATGGLGAMAILSIVAILGGVNAPPSSTRSPSPRSGSSSRSSGRCPRSSAFLSIGSANFTGNPKSTRMGPVAKARLKDIDPRPPFLPSCRNPASGAYLMRLEEGRVLFLCFSNPPEDAYPAWIQALPPDLATCPTTDAKIARGPASGKIVGVTFSASPLPVSTTFEVRQSLKLRRSNAGRVRPGRLGNLDQGLGCGADACCGLGPGALLRG